MISGILNNTALKKSKLVKHGTINNVEATQEGKVKTEHQHFMKTLYTQLNLAFDYLLLKYVRCDWRFSGIYFIFFLLNIKKN